MTKRSAATLAAILALANPGAGSDIVRTGGIRLISSQKQYVTIPDAAALDLAIPFQISLSFRLHRLPSAGETFAILSKGDLTASLGTDNNYGIWFTNDGGTFYLYTGFRRSTQTLLATTVRSEFIHGNCALPWRYWYSVSLKMLAGSVQETWLSLRETAGQPFPFTDGCGTVTSGYGLYEDTYASTPPTNSLALLIGASLTGGGVLENFADIDVTEVAIYTAALDVAQSSTVLTSRYGTRLAGTEANLEAYYRCDEGSGVTLYDITGNGHDGTLKNGVGWTDAPLDLLY